jgi:hypothetical protein
LEDFDADETVMKLNVKMWTGFKWFRVRYQGTSFGSTVISFRVI